MTYGLVRRHWPVVTFFLAVLADRPALSQPVPASELTVTLLSVGQGAIQVQGADGRVIAIKITPATWVLQRGLVTLPREMTPGEMLRVRLGRGKAGGAAALLVCDAETAEAIAAHRRQPLSGIVVSGGDKVWTVQPADGQTPLPICLSARTTFQAGGSQVAASAFGAGAAVTITTRGLANGLLSAVSVSDAAPDLPGQAAEQRTPLPRSVSGVISEVRPDLGLLTLQDTAGTSQTVAVEAATRVKSGGRAASLEDLQPGMRVRVRLSTAQDAAGNLVATSVSASDAKPTGKTSKKTRR